MFDRPASGTRAVVVQVDFSQGGIDERLAEVTLLTESAGATVVATVQGRRQAPDPAFYVGKGKADEIGVVVQLNEADIVFSITTSRLRSSATSNAGSTAA